MLVFIYRAEIDSQAYKIKTWLPKEKRRGEGWREGIVWEFGRDMYTLLYFKWMTNKDLLYSTGSSAQCYVAVWRGGEFGGECVCMLSRFSRV